MPNCLGISILNRVIVLKNESYKISVYEHLFLLLSLNQRNRRKIRVVEHIKNSPLEMRSQKVIRSWLLIK